jgi:hypothetical protein
LHNLRKFKIMAIANRFTVSLSVVRMWALLWKRKMCTHSWSFLKLFAATQSEVL